MSLESRKERLMAIALVILTVFSLYELQQVRRVEKTYTDWVDQLCLCSLSSAYCSFQNYQASPSEEYYYHGTYSFRTFLLLYEKSSFFKNHFYIEVIDTDSQLFIWGDQEWEDKHLGFLLEGLRILSEDPEDISGYTQLRQFCDRLL